MTDFIVLSFPMGAFVPTSPVGPARHPQANRRLPRRQTLHQRLRGSHRRREVLLLRRLPRKAAEIIAIGLRAELVGELAALRVAQVLTRGGFARFPAQI